MALYPSVRQAWACDPQSRLMDAERKPGTRRFFYPRPKPVTYKAK